MGRQTLLGREIGVEGSTEVVESAKVCQETPPLRVKGASTLCLDVPHHWRHDGRYSWQPALSLYIGLAPVFFAACGAYLDRPPPPLLRWTVSPLI